MARGVAALARRLGAPTTRFTRRTTPCAIATALALTTTAVAARAALAPAGTGCAPAGRALVGEVFYDASGDDTGFEFVELFNPSPVPVPLAGMRLEGGDGSGPDRWTLRWTGGAADTVRARGRFVIGGARVLPAPDAVAALDLQNGPDAVRVVWPDGASEVVGWGALEFAEYACGAPAADVASGQSLARVPDDAQLGSNRDDFRAAAPSPGAPNRPARDLALVPGSLAAAPERPAAGAGFRLGLRVANTGEVAFEAGAAQVVALVRDDAGATEVGRAPLAGPSPGETLAVTLDVAALTAGRARLRARVEAAGDERNSNDEDSLAVRVGPAPLEIAEIQFHPSRGEGEWIELRAAGPEDAALDGWSVADRTGTRGLARSGGLRVAPRERVVLAQNRRALLALDSALDTARVLAVSPWPSLNNADDAAGIADVIELREDDGTLAERLPYSATGVPAGVPLERDELGAWRAGSDPAGTPLAGPRVLPALGARFDVSPRRLVPGAALRLDWDLPWAPASLAVRVFDLEGRAVATSHVASRPPARGGARWVATALPPGLYVLALEARGAAGEGPVAATRAIRVVEAGR